MSCEGRILHLSDIHFGCENKDALAAVFDLAVREPFDLIAITGDITQYGAVAEFEAAKAWIDALPAPTLLTPGNHDTPWAGIVSRIVSPWGRYERAFGPSGHARFETQGLVASTFNTARGVQPRMNWSKGQAWRGHVARAIRSLATAPAGDLRVVLCHHPLTEMTGGPMTGKVWGGARAAAMLAEAKVDVILTGHVHSPFVFDLPLGGGGTYAVGASTLSQRLRGVPAGFNIIGYDADCLHVTAHGWTGSKIETLRTWSVARRPAPGHENAAASREAAAQSAFFRLDA